MGNKVVLLAPTPPPVGGIAMWTERMMNAKLENGWKVEVVDEKIIGKRELFGNKTKRNYFDEIKRCLYIWGELCKKIKDNDVKVVHSCIAANTLPVIREYICACIAKRKNKKFIIHFRCTVPNIIRGKINRFFVKKICDKSDCVILLNRQSVDYINKLTKAKIVLIPNFVDTQEIAKSHEIKEHIKTVLYVGGVIEKKGCLDIIELAKEFPDVEFRLVGNSEKKVEEAASEVNNVTLTGIKNRDEVQQEFANADVFIFLTYFGGEGFSNALAEAMGAGLPCLVTDWAANADMVEAKGGEIVPVKNPKEAKMALGRMMPVETRQRQSEFNREKVRLAYSDRVVLKKYVECYESLL